MREKWKERALLDEPLSGHTSWRVGGPCDLMVFPRDLEDLREILIEAGREGVPLFVMGRGSNLLVRDGGIPGVVINLSRGLKEMEFGEEGLKAGAGVDLPLLALRAAQQGLSGLEFAAGIPGTVGGGIKGNAGAFGSSLDQILERVKILNGQGQENIFSRQELAFSYRRCLLPGEAVVVEAEFRLGQGEAGAIQRRMDALQRKRQQSQPWQALTAGSVFKNPPGAYAGQIIDSLGLKGKIMGRARVSPLHGNFIENLGDARASDLLQLIELIRERAARELHIELELEIQVVGEE
ncbi:MAG: UDP-N-acetylmuramate dehydrogenase [candidate division NC10 bacterium]|nr:UDP-N-acetylmuramate dehydrogenase [candidate division NC10 bacterium]